MKLAIAGLAHFFFVGLRAFQSRNINYGNYKAVMITSQALALAEVYVIYVIADQGPSLALVATLGISSGLGCWLAMFIHSKLHRE